MSERTLKCPLVKASYQMSKMTIKTKAELEALKKQDEEATEVKSEEEETEEVESEEGENESSSTTEDEEVDYKTLLQAEKDRAEKAERALASDRYNASKKKREENTDDDSDEEDKPLTKKDLQNLLVKERQATQKAFEESRAIEIARKFTRSEDEANAALLYWRTRVVPTGNLEDDIQFAVGGLNSRKLTAEKAELMRALRNKDNVNRDSAGTHRDASIGTVPKLSSGDTAAYKRAGFAYDNATKVWKKKLPNGKFLVKDPSTKKTIVQ